MSKTSTLRALRGLLVLGTVFVAATRAAAQGPPPPLPHFVIDLRGTLPQLGRDAQLADSRGLSPLELPGRAFGGDAAANLYLFRWKAVTVGLGGQLTLARSHSSAQTAVGQTPLRAVTEQFASVAPQLSLNFGSGNGWSYISGGIGASTWSVVPDGAVALAADSERRRTTNYGAGARWFLNHHMAFHVDIRFYDVVAGQPSFGFPGSPRTTLFVLGAGVALK